MLLLIKKNCVFLSKSRTVFYYNCNIKQQDNFNCIVEKITTKIQNLYVAFLKKKNCPLKDIPSYIKWLQYYLDFCFKYSHIKSLPDSLSLFLSKLEQKNQSNRQIEQAKQAISLFYRLIEVHKNKITLSADQEKAASDSVSNNSTKDSNISKNQNWKKEFQMLNDEIKLRQYSPRT